LFGHVFSSRLRLQTRWHVHARVSAFGAGGKLGLVSGNSEKTGDRADQPETPAKNRRAYLLKTEPGSDLRLPVRHVKHSHTSRVKPVGKPRLSMPTWRNSTSSLAAFSPQ
jgi:hypothetical protein